MSALKPPPADAPPEEWGRFAVSIPGWQWPWTCSHTEVCPPMPGGVWIEGAWAYTDDITSVARWSRIRAIPDPDHWAWSGWMMALLGDTLVCVAREGRGWVALIASGDLEGYSTTLGRAAIAAAAVNGRWPGGGE